MADPLVLAARRVLEAHWDDERGYCVPNPAVYPHLWLWDSCFHAVAWAALGEAERAGRELRRALGHQLASGFVPHMAYAGPPGARRGPLASVSSFTQPPVYAHAAAVVARAAGGGPDADVVARVCRGLEHLWATRRTPEGLLVVHHPWETGADATPRWDDHRRPTGGPWDRDGATRWEEELVDSATYDAEGVVAANPRFGVAPAAFNAVAAHGAAALAALTGDGTWARRAQALAEAVDAHLWDPDEGLWRDLPTATAGGGGSSARTPTADALLGALVTPDAAKAAVALAQATDPERFGARFGLRYLPRSHPAYDPDAYWRGPAWPPINYLVWLAARRWGDAATAAAVAAMTRRGVLASGFAEYWNPDSGAGRGARPQSWAALAVALE